MPATPAIFQSFALGVNASRNPRLLQDGEVAMLVNGTVSSGHAAPRPPFIQHESAALDHKSSVTLARGIVQGMAFYADERGDALIIAADGYLFRQDLGAPDLQNIGGTRYFSRHSTQVYLCQRGPYMLAQDGISPPVVIHHKTATQGTHPTRSIPCGTLMADGWGRLAVASPDRRRIYFSNHSSDPNLASGVSTLPAGIDRWLANTEDTAYFKNARYFGIPASSGRIVGMTFTPSLNGDGDLGPLAVFCERSTWLYNTRVAREDWGTQDIASNPLPHIGACSANGVVVRGNDVIFSDQSGRIQQMRIAVRRNDDARLREHDANVKALLAADHNTHINRRLSLHLRSRYTLISRSPEVVHLDDGRYTVRHRSLLALNESPAVEADPVWDGIWTGIHPVAMCAAPYQGKDTAFFISLDSDGVNRIYRLGDSAGPDRRASTVSHQPMLTITRADVCGEPFKPKNFTSGAIRIGAARGTVKMQGAWVKDGLPPVRWFTDNHDIPAALNTCSGFPSSQDIPRITVPTPPDGSFTDCALAITITGQARLEECAIDAASTGPPAQHSTNECGTTPHCPINACPLDAFTYDLSKT